MTHLRTSLLSFALLAGIASVAAPNQAAAKTAKICPDIVKPVCAVNPAGARQTYPNACMARRAHARILAPGDCPGPICFFLFKPVCARNPATHKPQTYSNLCVAENANATLIHDGACK